MKDYPKRIPGESRSVEWDEEFGQWSIFGDDSGHCYGQYPSEELANDALKGN